MSDFDKEAEREKLREKYERDQQERQATQRMSDLLLKGATMTNAHCGTCGDPLFQMDGTTFCPSCHGNPDAVEGTDLEAQPAEETDAEATADPQADRTVSSGADEADATASEAEAESSGLESARTDRRRDRSADVDGASDEGEEPTDASAREHGSPSAGSQSRPQSRGDLSERDSRRSTDDRSAATDRPTSSRSRSGDLENAHDSLVAALEKFAEEAAATDDPRYAKECLEAAREAGETLETLR